jgi:uncharacterized membrane protein
MQTISSIGDCQSALRISYEQIDVPLLLLIQLNTYFFLTLSLHFKQRLISFLIYYYFRENHTVRNAKKKNLFAWSCIP